MINHPYRYQDEQARKRRAARDDLITGVLCVVTFVGYCWILAAFLLGD